MSGFPLESTTLPVPEVKRCKSELRVAAMISGPSRKTDPPVTKLSATPTPPGVVNAPVVWDVLFVVLGIVT